MNKIPLVSLGLGLLLIFACYNAFASDYSIDGVCVTGNQSCPTGFLLNEANRCIKADLWCKNEFDYNSFFNTETSACECIKDYFEQDGHCIAGGSYCRGLYGPLANYNSSVGACSCGLGYFFKNDECIQSGAFCSATFGENSRFSFKYNKCICKSGYSMYKRTCLTPTKICNEKYGSNVKANSTGECRCNKGYRWNSDNSQCVKENDTNLNEQYDYYKTRKQIACGNRDLDDARCFWNRIDLLYAKEILKKDDISDSITEKDIQRINSKISVIKRRYNMNCNVGAEAKYCSSLGKLIQRGDYFINKYK